MISFRQNLFTMIKTKTLGILAATLALINIGLVFIIMTGPPKHGGPGGFKSLKEAESHIQEKFGFDENQMKSFRESKEKHQKSSGELHEQLDELSGTFYMSDDAQDQDLRDSLLQEINEVSEKIYLNNSRHFDEVRTICSRDQLPELEHFISSLLKPRTNKRN